MKKMPLLLLIPVILLFPKSGFTTTYYVDKNHPSSSNANPGTSVNLPWSTIQHAADVLTAGDTVFIRNGTYYEHVEPVNSGDSITGYIIYSAFPGEHPAIDTTSVGGNHNGFVIYLKSYIKLLGMEVRNWWDNGIMVNASDHIEISDCEVHHCGGSIGMGEGTHDFELNNVVMHHFILFGFDASPAGGDPCCNGVFNDCVAYTGQDTTQNVDGFALGHGTQSNFVFNRCKVYDVFDGFDMSSRNTTLNRCASYNTWNAGFKLWQSNIRLVNCLCYHNQGAGAYVAWSGTPKAVTLQNCDFVGATTFNVWIENSQDTLNMYNCIIAGGDNIALAFEQMGTDNYHGDYNVFHNNDPGRAITVGYTDEFTLNDIASGAWTAYSSEDAHSIVSNNPDSDLFINSAVWDLQLRYNSIAIDAGTNTNAPSEDYDGYPRPYGATTDIGTYEWHPGMGINIQNFIPGLFNIFPNPVDENITISTDICESGEYTLSLLDYTGKEIFCFYKGKIVKGNFTKTYNLSNISDGIYLLTLSSDNFSGTFRLIKNKTY